MTSIFRNVSEIPLDDYLDLITDSFPNNIELCVSLADILYRHIKQEDSKRTLVEYNGRSASFQSHKFYSLLGQVFGTCQEREKDSLLCYYKTNLYAANLKPEVVKKNRNVFSFRNINEFSLADMSNNTITVVSPLKMNDPSDTLIYDWADAKYNHWKNIEQARGLIDVPIIGSLFRSGEIYKESFEKYRVRSFCESRNGRIPYQNTLMWSHYAGGHTGYCIEYSLSREMQAKRYSTGYLCTRAINYISLPINLEEKVEEYGEDLLFAKSSDWAYENEVRMLTYDYGVDKDFMCIPLDSDSSIVSIYFGVKCREESKQMIRNILKDCEGIKFYQMKKDYTNIYTLKAEEL